MREIKPVDVNGVPFKQVLDIILSQPPVDDAGNVRGFLITEMIPRLDIMKKVKASKDPLIVEEAEWAVIKECIEVHRWAMLHEDIRTFRDTIINAEEVTI